MSVNEYGIIAVTGRAKGTTINDLGEAGKSRKKNLGVSSPGKKGVIIIFYYIYSRKKIISIFYFSSRPPRMVDPLLPTSSCIFYYRPIR